MGCWSKFGQLVEQKKPQCHIKPISAKNVLIFLTGLSKDFSFLFIILYPSIFSPFDQVSISFLPIYPFSNSSLCLSVSVSWYLFFGLCISIMIPIFMSLSLFSLDIPIFPFSLSLCLSISVSWYLFLFYFFCISIMIPIFLFFVIGTYIFVFR